ncbi:MAG: PD40 domain-containing protein [Saprospiraceae bacterium]|nr:PD40 domain-containing protein [Saprospiraceae bacterium]
MKRFGFILLICSLYLCVTPCYGQKRQAKIFFDAQKYNLALKEFNKIKKINKKPDLLIKRGYCYLMTNQPDLCIKDMEAAHELKSMDEKRFKYMAQAYFSKGEYDKAATFYKIYLNKLKVGKEDWQSTINEIKRCGYAQSVKYLPSVAFVENLGKNVNTIYTEVNPVQSPNNPERYYFSSDRDNATGGMRNSKGLTDTIKGHYFADIYFIELIDGNWTKPDLANPLINSPKHEWIQDFNQDGSILYYLKSMDKNFGALYTDTFGVINALVELKPLNNLPIRPENGDKDLYFFNDSLMIFSSSRPGGYGGFDLYYATRQNGSWLPPVNFGSKVNSIFDEVSPYLSNDGKVLYFSSDRLEGLGGFDIYSAEYQYGKWSTPINMGLPVNSPSDDLYLRISSDGNSGLLASNRITSIGNFDLYIAYFKNQIVHQLQSEDGPAFLEYQTESTYENGTPKKVDDLQNIREIVVKPLFYQNDGDILSNINRVEIRHFAGALAIYPDSKIVLKCHSAPISSPSIEIFYTLKRTEKVVEELVRYGIKPENIIIQGFGANYPLMAQEFNGIKLQAAPGVNSRIDLYVIPGKKSNIHVIYDLPAVADNLKDKRWSQMETLNNDLTYRVLFAKATQILDNNIVKSDGTVMIEKYPDADYYLYTLGNYKDYHQAVEKKNQLLQEGYKDATILPYYNGIKLTIPEIGVLKDQYPQLKSYLRDF